MKCGEKIYKKLNLRTERTETISFSNLGTFCFSRQPWKT